MKLTNGVQHISRHYKLFGYIRSAHFHLLYALTAFYDQGQQQVEHAKSMAKSAGMYSTDCPNKPSETDAVDTVSF